jgi:hypothetical protein
VIDAGTAFSLGGLLAMAGWAILVVALFAPRTRRFGWVAAQFAIPAILAVGYLLLLWDGRGAFESGGFGSIGEVRSLFLNDDALAAGWLHYLAFDLFIGAWIARDGTARGISGLIVLPCLPLTFLFGPAGLLLYLAIRLVFRRPLKEISQ